MEKGRLEERKDEVEIQKGEGSPVHSNIINEVGGENECLVAKLLSKKLKERKKKKKKKNRTTCLRRCHSGQ